MAWVGCPAPSGAYRLCRVPATCSAALPAQAAGFAANKLAGAPLHTLPGGRTVVPLLTPQQHGLPFALTLELHAAPAPGAAPPPPPPAAAADRSLFALHYVLAGQGQLVRPAGAEQLQAGDAVVMHAGAAACRAGGAGQAAAAAAAGPYSLAELVAYMPQQLFEELDAGQQQQHAAAAAVSASLPTLLPLAPGGSEQRLPPDLAAALLAGAKDTAQATLQALDDAEAAAEAAEAAQQPDGGGGAPAVQQLLQAAAGSLAAWWRRQQGRTCPVTRKSLGELTAFRLPNQTNRLAVQFDPFSQPAVPFISGIEVFEPGHRTTPHVHPRAHELFFILAGRGEGFCDDRRFPVAAGDVVVFRPGARHGIDNSAGGRMYCLELMVPNEQFAEFVRAGTDTGTLSPEDLLCVMMRQGCR